MTNQIKDGGPAFPFVSNGGVHEHQACFSGMTLRDYIAIHALIEDIGTYRGWKVGALERLVPTKSIPDARYAYADAMLKAREVSHE